MRVLVIDNDYPNEDNLYGDVFVHVRVKEYQKRHTCVVVSFTAKKDFEFEGVPVKAFADIPSANIFIKEYEPDLILIHFVSRAFVDEIIPVHKCPYLVWVHGYEALSWRRRMFNYTWRNFMPLMLYMMLKTNRRQLQGVASLVKQSDAGARVHFVFVSNWMKKMCERDTGVSVNKYSIIPNPIDTTLFQYEERDPEQRKKILLIRPFSTKKYATDIASKALQLLASEPFFKELHITIVGKGRYFDTHTAPLRAFENVTLVNRFLTQAEIKEYHRQHGIFLCPTRQDAQGVSMCEAMSSGLVPITSNNTAIPEFVEHGVSGLLTNDAAGIAKAITHLYHHPEDFIKMSAGAAQRIVATCQLDVITRKELALMNSI